MRLAPPVKEFLLTIQAGSLGFQDLNNYVSIVTTSHQLDPLPLGYDEEEDEFIYQEPLPQHILEDEELFKEYTEPMLFEAILTSVTLKGDVVELGFEEFDETVRVSRTHEIFVSSPFNFGG